MRVELHFSQKTTFARQIFLDMPADADADADVSALSRSLYFVLRSHPCASALYSHGYYVGSLLEPSTSEEACASAACASASLSPEMMGSDKLDSKFGSEESEISAPSTSASLLRCSLQSLHAEILHLHALQLMSPNAISFKTSQASTPHILIKPHIFEADMHLEKTQTHAPVACALWKSNQVVDAFQQNEQHAYLNIASHANEDRPAFKLQLNEGNGACFPWHHDNAGGGTTARDRGSRRKITVIVYLSEPPTQGGELVLMPFCKPELERRVTPVVGTVVAFRSECVLHRTLPSFCDKAHNQRTCFTIWLESDDAANAPLSCALPPELLTNLRERRGDDAGAVPYSPMWREFADKLSTSPANRIFARLVYREMFEASLRECFSVGGGETAEKRTRVALAMHEAHMRSASDALREVADALTWVLRQRIEENK